jgi:voltage-gated potassium channel Kch
MEDRPPRLRGHSPFQWRENMRHAVASRRVFPYLAGMTVALGLLAGFIVTLVDRKDFPTFGTGVWWAIVTLGTVGYGDVVPHTAWGRVLGSLVIVIGVTFIAFLTATVTSYFVAAEEGEARAASQDELVGGIAQLVDALAGIEARLAAIEAKLGP